MFFSILAELMPVDEPRKTYETTRRIRIRNIFLRLLGSFPQFFPHRSTSSITMSSALFSLWERFLPLCVVFSLPHPPAHALLFFFFFFFPKGHVPPVSLIAWGSDVRDIPFHLMLIFPMAADVPIYLFLSPVFCQASILLGKGSRVCLALKSHFLAHYFSPLSDVFRSSCTVFFEQGLTLFLRAPSTRRLRS